MGSSRPRNTYSMIDTTSGMLARKQMIVSTGTYCGKAEAVFSGVQGSTWTKYVWSCQGRCPTIAHAVHKLYLSVQVFLVTWSALTLQYRKPAKQHTTAMYFLPFSHLHR